MKTTNDTNKNDANAFSEKPYSKIEPVTNHDAGLNDDNEELYGDPQHEEKSSTASTPDKDDPDGSDYFEEEEKVINDDTKEVEY